MLPRSKSFVILKGCLGVVGTQSWLSPEVSGGPGYRDTAVKKPLYVFCREGLRRNLFTFLLLQKSPFTRLVDGQLMIGTLKSNDIRAGVAKPVGCSSLAVP